MSALLLDTHVLYWLWAGDRDRLSAAANRALDEADHLAVAAISWYELALLFERGRIELLGGDVAAVLASMADRVATEAMSWSIAKRAAELESFPSFPRDPADRLIYATARERSLRLVTADQPIRSFAGDLCIW